MASRRDPRETDDMAYAAMRMAEAAERMAEALSHPQGGHLTEEEADRLALAAVRRDRAAAERVAEDRPPVPRMLRAGSPTARSCGGSRGGGTSKPLPGPVVVLGTQVVVSAPVGPEDGSSHAVVRAATGEFGLAISDDFLREVSRVIRYLDVVSKIADPTRAFDVALEIGLAGETNRPRRPDWPSLRDPKDGWMLDLAWNAAADFVVTRDPRVLNQDLPFPIGNLATKCGTHGGT